MNKTVHLALRYRHIHKLCRIIVKYSMYLVMDLMDVDLPEVKELQSLYIYNTKTFEITENGTS